MRGGFLRKFARARRPGPWTTTRSATSQAPPPVPSLTATLDALFADMPQRPLWLASLRALSSRREYIADRRRLLPVYAALEKELDAQVAALADDDDDDDATAPPTPEPAPQSTTEPLAEFSSLTGAAAAVWRALGPRVRRSEALRGEISAASGGAAPLKFASGGATASHGGAGIFDEDELLSPAIRQYVRRIRAAATVDGDLLLGHVVTRYVFCDGAVAARVAPWFWTTGHAAHPGALDGLDDLRAAIDDVADERLDDDKHMAVIAEALRSFDLSIKLVQERPLLLGAVSGAAKLVMSAAQHGFRRSPPPAPAKED